MSSITHDVPHLVTPIPRKSDQNDPSKGPTPDCISLRFEVADLLKRGHLQDLLSDKGRNTIAQREA